MQREPEVGKLAQKACRLLLASRLAVLMPCDFATELHVSWLETEYVVPTQAVGVAEETLLVAVFFTTQAVEDGALTVKPVT